jgi:Fur family ferric uptake transcriptional regulator
VVDRASVGEAFRAYLRDHNLPVTRQRDIIAEIVLGSDRHHSVEEVASAVRARGGTAGLATVYRTMELLVRSGLVVERDFGEGFRRYETTRDAPHHEHLLCTRCGRVTEFRDERLERMTTVVAETRGYLRESHRLVIYGVCDACRTGSSTRS